ncbi:MAG: type II toxin-antitoxin system VapC family toxin [Anaerolineae bacterium]
MTAYFFDSSALVKRYLSERGSSWVGALAETAARNTLIIAEITRVEIAAALASRQRAPSGITQSERERLFRLLVRHNTVEYDVIPISTSIVDHAMELTQRYRLRGYDAVQLATALDVRSTALSAGLSPVTFVTADEDLIAAALAEGLAADNPNDHP